MHSNETDVIWLKGPACHAETSEKATGKESMLMHKCIMHECKNSVKRDERNAGDEGTVRWQPECLALTPGAGPVELKPKALPTHGCLRT